MPHLVPFKTQNILSSAIASVAIFAIASVGSAPETNGPISADEFIRAVANNRTALIDWYFVHHLDPNARAKQDRPLLVAAVLQQDAGTIQRLLRAGACVDLADESGLTPLMAAAMNGNIELIHTFLPLATNPAATDRNGRTALDYAVAAGKNEAVEVLLPTAADLARRGKDGRDLFAVALDSGNPQIIDLILDRLPRSEEWNASALRALDGAIATGNKDQFRLLLSKHVLPPSREGKSVPLLAYAMASNNLPLFNLLLECGADPNTTLPDKCDEDFLALLPPKLRNYIDGDKGITSLMLAAGLGQADNVRSLLKGGADRDRATKRYKMLPLYLAAQTGKWQCTQILLGSGPAPEELRIEISLSSQHAAVIKDGVPIFSTVCSTGRSGYSTRTGDYIITDKDRSHRSTIYKVEMPYFMRLSCLDFGMHEGVVPNYPASHGCIRLPGEAARKLFAEIPVGTVVTVK
jgi:ankyrin repeat protein